MRWDEKDTMFAEEIIFHFIDNIVYAVSERIISASRKGSSDADLSPGKSDGSATR